jgi:hypothetical protein
VPDVVHVDADVGPTHLAGVGEQALDDLAAAAGAHLFRVVETADRGHARQRERTAPQTMPASQARGAPARPADAVPRFAATRTVACGAALERPMPV